MILRISTAITSPRKGFVLLAVVACLLLITVASVAVARRSLLVALEARESLDELQLRWGSASLERAATQAALELFANPPPGQEMLSRSGPAPPHPQLAVYVKAERLIPNRFEIPIELGERHYRLILADESAKANLNSVNRVRGRSAVQQLAKVLGIPQIRADEFPVFSTRSSADANLRVETWGQVFSLSATSTNTLRWPDIPDLVTHITLWGEGKLNIHRASDETLFQMSRLVISEGESRDWIEEFHRSYPQKSLDRILGEVGLDGEEKAALLQLLSNRSSAISVWVLTNSPSAPQSLVIAASGPSTPWVLQTSRYAVH